MLQISLNQSHDKFQDSKSFFQFQLYKFYIFQKLCSYCLHSWPSWTKGQSFWARQT